jgi:fatty acid/phospholipid biosynthesis enzyme
MKVTLNINGKNYVLGKLSPKKYKRFRNMLKNMGDMDLFGENVYTDEALEEVFDVVSDLFEGELTIKEIEENGDISEIIAFVREIQYSIQSDALKRTNKVYEDFFQKSAAILAQKTSNNS